MPQHEDLHLTDTFTLSAWVNWLNMDAEQSGTLLSKDGLGGNPTGAYNVYLTKTAHEVPYTQYATNNVNSLYAHWGLTDNAWHQVVVTFDASADATTHIYVDGIERGAGDVAAPSALATDLLIGRRGWEGEPRHFKGLIDEVRLYNRTLSKAEISASYYAYREPGGSPELIAAYPFSEGTGTIATDVSGHGRDGMITNAVWTSEGIAGNALHFDGDGDYVEIPHPGALREGSMAAWIRPDSAPPGESWFAVTLGSKPPGGGGDGVNLGVPASYTDHLAFGIYSKQWNWADSGITPRPGQWYHLVGTWGQDGLTIYVNGELKGTDPYQGGVPGSTQYACLAANTWNQYFHGTMDEVNLYNYALSASEVHDLYGSSNPGLIAAYPFDEGTGSTTADTSGNGHDGTLMNGVTWTTDGKVGQALSLDGQNDYVAVNDGLVDQNIMSVAAWIKKAPAADGNDVIVAGERAPDGATYFLGEWALIGNGSLTFGIYDFGGSGWHMAQSGITITDSRWHYVVGVSDGAQTRIYLDGVLRGTGTTTALSATVATSIGRTGWSGNRAHFHGVVDEVRVYPTALTDSDIQALYEESQPDALLAAYPFDEGSGATTADASGNGHDGTISGASWTTSGKDGNALSFDGVNDYVKVDASGKLNAQNMLTLSAWIKPEGSTSQPILEYNTGSQIGVHLWQFNSFDTLFVNFADINGTSHTLFSPANQLIAGVWQHVAAVYDGAYGRLFINGQEVSSQYFGSITLNTAYDLYIGARISHGVYYQGSIDEVRIYDRALSLSEILGEFQQGAGAASLMAAPMQAESVEETSLRSTTADIVSLNGQTLRINVADSPELNYGVGEFSVAVQTGSAGIENAAASPAANRTQSKETSHTAVGVRRGDTLFLYLDGALQAQRSIGDRAVNVLTIHVGDSQARRVIEDVRLYDRALTPDEIEALSPAVDVIQHPEQPQARDAHPALPMN